MISEESFKSCNKIMASFAVLLFDTLFNGERTSTMK